MDPATETSNEAAPQVEQGAAQESQEEVRQRAMTIDDVAARVEEKNLLGAKPPTPEKSETVAEPEQPTTSEEASAEPAQAEPAGTAEEQRALDLIAIAEHLGVEVDDLYGIEVATKVDGEEGRATLRDLQKSYQLSGHLNKRAQQFAEREKQMAQEFNERVTAKETELEGFIELAGSQLKADIGNIDWASLKENDPTEYSRQWIAMKEREEQLNTAIRGLQQRREERQHEFQSQQVEEIRRQEGTLLDIIPTWGDSKVREAEQDQIRGCLQEHYGFKPDELAGIIDARQVSVVRDAWRYRQLMATKPSVTKKLRAAPKPTKTSAKQEAANVTDEAIKDAQKAVVRKAKTGRSNIDEMADLLYRKGIT